MLNVLAPSYDCFLAEFSDYKRKNESENLIYRWDHGKPHAIFLSGRDSVLGRKVGDLVFMFNWEMNKKYDDSFIS